MRPWLLAAALACAAPARAAAVGDGSGSLKGYNVILVTLTAVGASHLGVYGYERPTTPFLDSWSKDALVFDDAYTHASWTLPVGSSLMTGLFPYTHGVWRRDIENVLDPADPTLAELLARKGYLTAAFAGGLDYYYLFSHLRGFQFKAPNAHYTGFSVTVPQAQEWLKEYGRGHKFFLFVQGYDAHCPFLAQAPYRGLFTKGLAHSPDFDPTRCVRGFRRRNGSFKASYAGGCARLLVPTPNCAQGEPVNLEERDVRYIEAAYDETVRQADDYVRQLLSSVPPDVAQRTIVVVASEHGEMFAEHGRFGRAGTRRGVHYNEVLKVPLLVRVPGWKPRRVKGLAEIVDLMPTLLDWLGVPIPKTVQGRSLVPLVHDGKPVNEYVYSGLPYNLRMQTDLDRELFTDLSLSETVQDSTWTLVHETVAARDGGEPAGETWELYDTAADPAERDDVASSHPEVLARLRQRLSSWRQETLAARRKDTPGAAPLPESMLEKARERGYWQ